MNQKIRIKLKSFDHNLVDKSAEKIVKTVKSTGAVVSGPVPLPTHKQIFTVNRSTFVNKKAREQFQLCTFKRILDIYSSTPKTIDALMKLELPSVWRLRSRSDPPRRKIGTKITFTIYNKQLTTNVRTYWKENRNDFRLQCRG